MMIRLIEGGDHRRWRLFLALLLITLSALLLSTHVVKCEADAGQPSQEVEASGTPSPKNPSNHLYHQQQTSVLDRCWWRNLEEQDAFIRTLFRKPLASANIGVVSSVSGGDTDGDNSNGNDDEDSVSHGGKKYGVKHRTAKQSRQAQQRYATRGRAVAHHAPANVTDQKKRFFIPRLRFVYTMTEEESQQLAAQSVATEATADTQSTAADGSAAAGAASYTQRLRSVLPLGLGGVADSVERPLTPLQVAARRSPIAHLRAFVRDGGSDDDRERDGVRSGSVTAAEAETEDDAEKTAAATTTTIRDDEKNSAVATNMAEEEELDASLTRERSTATTPGTSASTQDPRSSYASQSEAEEKLVVVSSDTKALIPLTITGSSYTIVQFNGKAGNTINAVVQLKDHRFNKYVRVNNCHSMYITVELRNHVKTQSDTTTTTAAAAEAGDAAKWRTLPIYAQAYRSLWGSASADSSADHDAGSSSSSSSDGPDVTSNGRGGFASFWNSFALMFDTSALCKVMASLPLRIDKAPRTEPFYVVMRSTISYAYDRAYYYNTSSGTFYTNPRDDDYTCELDLYMEQWPAAQQERKQFLFAFVLPLLVLLLPLPFTMRRADLVQQYMMETDYAQWVWRPPYYLRDKLIDGLKAMMNWVVNLRTSLQQRRLMAQLQQQQQQQQRQGDAVVPSDTNSGAVTGRTTFMNAPGTIEPGMTAAAAAATYHSTVTPSEAPTTMSTAQHATTAVGGVGQTNNESSPHVPQLAARDLHAPSPYNTIAAAAAHSETDGGGEGHHGVCTPRQQQQQLARSGVLVSSPCSSNTSYDRSLTGSMNGSDCDDGHDCHCGCSHHGDHPQHRYQKTHPGAVSPPQSSACAPDTLLCAGPACSSAPLATSASVADAGVVAAAHQDDDVEEEGQEDGDSRRHSCTSKRGSKTTTSSSNTNNRRCHHHCRHHDDDGSEHHAVSVHVPLLLESPVVNNARPTGRHASAHDLLFNATEAAAAAGGQQQEFIKTHTGLSREEKADAEEPHADGVVMSTKATGWDSRNKRPTDDKSAEGNGTASATTTATAAAGAAEEEDEEPFCRICREGSDVAPLITPCGCTGSVRFVHSSCLDRWRIESAKRNLSNVNHCEICKMPFTVNIRRSALIWESSQHLLRGISLFLTCFTVIVLTTTLTHGILGELSCLASYHEVAYSTMFRFEGLSLSLFVYGLAVLLVLFANLIVYSWFRSRREVEEYVADLHVVPPFYTTRNMALIVLVSLLLLAQVHAMGFLLKYFLYNTSNLVWSWETSPLVGGMLFALFMTCSITVCSWGRQMYMTHVAPRLMRTATAEDVVVVDGNTSSNNGNGNHRGDENVNTAREPAAAAAAEPFDIPTSTTLNYMGPPPSRSQQQQQQHLVRGSELAAAGSPSQPPPHPLSPSLSSAGAAGTRAQPEGVPVEEDVTYTRHFEVPPEHRVIRAFEYCPPTRKVPK